MEKNEIGGAYSTNGESRYVYTGLWWGNLRERDDLKEPGVHGTIILRWILRNWDVVDRLDRDGSG